MSASGASLRGLRLLFGPEADKILKALRGPGKPSESDTPFTPPERGPGGLLTLRGTIGGPKDKEKTKKG